MFYLLADFTSDPKSPTFFAASTALRAIHRARAHIDAVEPDVSGMSDEDLVELYRADEADICELVKIPEPMPKKRSDKNFFGLYQKYWSGTVPNPFADFKPEE